MILRFYDQTHGATLLTTVITAPEMGGRWWVRYCLCPVVVQLQGLPNELKFSIFYELRFLHCELYSILVQKFLEGPTSRATPQSG